VFTRWFVPLLLQVLLQNYVTDDFEGGMAVLARRSACTSEEKLGYRVLENWAAEIPWEL